MNSNPPAPLSPLPAPVRLLICDDWQLARVQVRQSLDGVPWVNLVGEAVDGDMAVSMAVELKPDLILMDLSMPVLDGIQAIRKILTELPDVRILAFSADSDSATIKKAMDAGARGFLEKSCGSEALLLALEKLRQGEIVVWVS